MAEGEPVSEEVPNNLQPHPEKLYHGSFHAGPLNPIRKVISGVMDAMGIKKEEKLERESQFTKK